MTSVTPRIIHPPCDLACVMALLSDVKLIAFISSLGGKWVNGWKRLPFVQVSSHAIPHSQKRFAV
jgi:hypothetical protein